ncbi:MAG: helix-turn-helix transcriptional regulator [Lachnospiraceae bacterium]|nr:helix-turn-helix transcriptional regulator [Lachnospiraceae bacterium]MBR5066641.1 helix-turn-helix transcriptional regulator [Lachnospiraceae bacterium]
MNWDEYKKQVKKSDPIAKEILEESEAEAAIISALIRQRAALGLSQRDLASLCNIPQSSVARIESNKITPRLDTILKLLNEMGLTLSVTKMPASKG